MSEAFDAYRKWLGIPPEEQPPNHYRLLGIPLWEEDADVVENSAHRQMAYVRTFQSGPHAAESQKLLNELATAKVCLLNRDKKRAYDEALRAKISTPPPLPAEQLAGGETKRGAVPPVVKRPAESVRTTHVDAKQRRSSNARNESRRTDAGKRKEAESSRSRWLLWAPLATGLGAILVIVAAVVVSIRFRQTADDENTPEGASDAHVAQATSSNNPGESADHVPTTGSDPSSHGRSSESSSTFPPTRLSERESRVQQQLAQLRDEFGRRDLSRLRTISTVANRPQRNSRLKQDVEQTQMLGRYLEDFWKVVARGLRQAERDLKKQREANEETGSPASAAGGEPVVRIEFHEHVLEIAAVDDDKLSLRADNETRTLRMQDLSSLDAAALAVHGLKSDDLFGLVYVATFLCVDTKGDRAANVRLAKVIADDLAKRGDTPFPYLESEVRRATAARE